MASFPFRSRSKPALDTVSFPKATKDGRVSRRPPSTSLPANSIVGKTFTKVVRLSSKGTDSFSMRPSRPSIYNSIDGSTELIRFRYSAIGLPKGEHSNDGDHQ